MTQDRVGWKKAQFVDEYGHLPRPGEMDRAIEAERQKTAPPAATQPETPPAQKPPAQQKLTPLQQAKLEAKYGGGA